ncbi:uncharacterized protein STEHIDRAFT_103330 [Stereum hirsutum FP-91666 SS1]|uniref:uncharacterized protein n=1 Tax=Stereum hirsutum (strain FP-91666) TaxID=721885 RepID=UPI000444A0B2|nr:uncharacterized protein STEHIDRAFT_103330 [Stereum hirsutum FP-91666 SS1]EIM81915.1 hypothetical protein STEHIDRAFT_103330 [Stereum hirsutum FP-91666 SS1]
MDAANANTNVPAGRLPEEVYTNTLSPWRAAMRRQLVEIVEWESGVLAKVQVREYTRTPSLDAYFVYTSMLGTHTFFMMFLPSLFFFGYDGLGRGLVYVLALGGYSASFLKDLMCSPRPFAPPVTRLTIGSHHLEYGFPSSHSTNAVSMALFFLGHAYELLREDMIAQQTFGVCIALAIFYILSIVGGRLYTGMHGFVDVTAGSLLGTAMWLVQIYWMPHVEQWIMGGGWYAPLTVTAIGLLLVNQHPQPVDDCPCFEDAIAFISVMLGVLLGFSFSANFPAFSSPTALSSLPGMSPLNSSYTPPSPFSEPSTITATSFLSFLFISTLKMVSGTLVILVFRLIAKPVLHSILPPLFRFLAHTVTKIRPGWGLPNRRHYTPATEYGRMPAYVYGGSGHYSGGGSGGSGGGAMDGGRGGGRGLGELRPIPSMIDLSLEMQGAGWEEVSGGHEQGITSGQRVGGGRGAVGGWSKITRRGAGGTGAANEGSVDEKKAGWSGWRDGENEDEGGEGERIGLGFSEVDEGGARDKADIVKHYDADVLTKVFVYAGIAIIASVICPASFEAVGWGVLPHLG